MHLLTFASDNGPRLGVVDHEGGIVDVAARDPDPAFSSMQALIEAGPEKLDLLRGVVAASGPSLPVDAIQWLPPLPQPTQMRDFIVFEEHMRMAGWNGARLREQWGAPPAPSEPPPVPPVWYEQPIYYKCNRFGMSAHLDQVKWPSYSRVIDYELEIACIIGTGGCDIKVEDAPKHIFGYTILNDLTARDAQFREMQGPLGPAKGKDFDGANVLGPVVVTADAIDPAALRMRAYVNDDLWSDGSSATMHWSFAQMIAHVSQSETLYPGEIFGSGTVGGGCGLELGRFLKHGDIITLEVDGIGRLTTAIDAPHVPQGVRL
ncbi:fumarylacetoacetate (FAA) hydrolase [Sphingobium chlorophenolicum L-1]|uniref:Fumarylacetoacetate (FAA) hydrolase n=1 Tax=Sphingobium chlorophenolicum L-1 TaxID=690566 RepID=F6F1S1_SPHCR|nr:fumarylacetoacetate hydrolase family protein [Sphingobium chlorophenolicum]AEG51487.1 fumarylacetoacetate (FAA) hydrolase [Sphingobium chlorophenolicum L-1]